MNLSLVQLLTTKQVQNFTLFCLPPHEVNQAGSPDYLSIKKLVPDSMANQIALLVIKC